MTYFRNFEENFGNFEENFRSFSKSSEIFRKFRKFLRKFGNFWKSSDRFGKISDMHCKRACKNLNPCPPPPEGEKMPLYLVLSQIFRRLRRRKTPYIPLFFCFIAVLTLFTPSFFTTYLPRGGADAAHRPIFEVNTIDGPKKSKKIKLRQKHR